MLRPEEVRLIRDLIALYNSAGWEVVHPGANLQRRVGYRQQLQDVLALSGNRPAEEGVTMLASKPDTLPIWPLCATRGCLCFVPVRGEVCIWCRAQRGSHATT